MVQDITKLVCALYFLNGGLGIQGSFYRLGARKGQGLEHLGHWPGCHKGKGGTYVNVDLSEDSRRVNDSSTTALERRDRSNDSEAVCKSK